MTESKLFRIVSLVSVASLLIPIIVGTTSGSKNVAEQKLQKYLKIADSSIHPDSGVKITEVKANPETSDKKDATTPTTDTKAEDAKPKTEATRPTQGSTAQPADTKKITKAATEYVVKEGDTYGCIAEKYYGSFGHFSDVMSANSAGVVPGYSEYQLNVGAKLQLPAVNADSLLPATTLCK